MLRRRALVLALSISLSSLAIGQNSTRKARPEPSEEAAAAGSAVPWRSSVEEALAESKRSGRPVFWYVPTVVGSPMDRKVELDRYMMAGPFSWPHTVAVLTEYFVPVRARPGRDEQAQYDLRPGEFIEPGFLVLDGDGEARSRMDQITTFHLTWFLTRLVETLPPEMQMKAREFIPPQPQDVPETASDRQFTPWSPVAEDLVWNFYRDARPGTFQPDDVEPFYALTVVADAGAPDPTPAITSWHFKLIAEREGHGPFRSGFEVPFRLPDEIIEAPAVRGTRAPLGVYDAAALRASGVRFFAWMQQEDGGFTDSRYDFGGADSMPNVWAAVTALAGRAMLDVARRSDEESLRTEASRIAERALNYVLDDDHIEFDDSDEIAWAHIYCARFAIDWLDHREDRRRDAMSLVVRSLGKLLELQESNGAWSHEYPNPFVTASVMIAIAEGSRLTDGIRFSVDPELVERGTGALRRCRAESGAIAYSDRGRGRVRAHLEGSVGRMPVVEHALQRHAAGDDGALERAIEKAFEFHREMDAVRKYDDHASRYGYGGFFFWYGMHGRAEAISALPKSEKTALWNARLRNQVMALPEIDGCFVDSHELGRVYGTAMALLCLGYTEPE